MTTAIKSAVPSNGETAGPLQSALRARRGPARAMQRNDWLVADRRPGRTLLVAWPGRILNP